MNGQIDDNFISSTGGKLAFWLALVGVVIIAILTIRYNWKYTETNSGANVFNLFTTAFKKLELPKWIYNIKIKILIFLCPTKKLLTTHQSIT